MSKPLTADVGEHCKHVDLGSKVIVPDVLVQPHMASLEMTFYPGSGSFPAQYRDGIFAAEHGSWNRKNRAGYEVIWIPMQNGHPKDGSYEDFLSGFVTSKGEVRGRPVGVTVGNDGALYVADDREAFGGWLTRRNKGRDQGKRLSKATADSSRCSE